ncbi:MAG: alpha/beta hydrolase family protein [Syntrophothermus sp.]
MLSHHFRSLFILFILLISNTFAQQEYFQVAGTWSGRLEQPNLRLVFNIEADSTGILRATMDSPDQGAKKISTDTVIVKGDTLRIEIKKIQGYYLGVISEDYQSIKGNWNQGGYSLKLDLIRGKLSGPNRPQEPKQPYPYKEEEVVFQNSKDNIKLFGTLTLPEKGEDFPAVILVTGSGPQNRNEELMGHKPFLVLSDYLTRRGIAVLRYDDRGVGKSEGNFSSAITPDFTQDALSAIEYLKTRKEINKDKLGVIGHSEGGMIAPLVANKDKDVSFIVLLAGPGLTGEQILLKQAALIQKVYGFTDERIAKEQKMASKIYDVLRATEDTVVTRQKIEKLLDEYYITLDSTEKSQLGNSSAILKANAKSFYSPWFRYFLNYDPAPELKKIKIPVLALNGDKDLQVPADENLKAIEDALNEGGNDDYKIVKMPGLNHLFQKSVTGSPEEYGKSEETFNEDAMKIIADWILEITD